MRRRQHARAQCHEDSSHTISAWGRSVRAMMRTVIADTE